MAGDPDGQPGVSGGRGAGQPPRALPLLPLEAATGLLMGEDQPTIIMADRGDRDPGEALVASMAEVLARGPCYVSFSGGRDSSAVLAMAVRSARRHGLPDPIPLTLRFPEVPSTRESEWQELVVDHLGLDRWEVIELRHELDWVGELAQRGLRAHGLMWPPNTHFHAPMFERARGGSLMTGFDGDGLLGYWRWGHAQSVLHGWVRPVPRDLARVALALAPPWARERLMRPPLLRAVPWLTAEGRVLVSRVARAEEAAQPRRWDRWLVTYGRRRWLRVTTHSLRTLGRDYDVDVVHPFLDGRFIAALARAGAGAGFGDRSSTMRRLFGDVLPETLVERPRKAEFGRAFWGPRSRSFAERWDGTGVDTDLVDPELLRQAWRAPNPFFGSSTLLQMTWLSAQPAAPASGAPTPGHPSGPRGR